MFWGLIVEHGSRYHQLVDSSFHISKAVGKNLKDCPLELVVRFNKQDFVLCILTEDQPQHNLDLNFTEGEEIEFFLTSSKSASTAVVCLTGYYRCPSLAPPYNDYETKPRRAKINGTRKRGIGEVNGDQSETALECGGGGDEGAGSSGANGKVAKTEGGSSSLAELITTLGAGHEDDEDDEDFDAENLEEVESDAEIGDDDIDPEEEEDDDDDDADVDEDELAGLKEDLDVSLTDLKLPPVALSHTFIKDKKK